jgi:preprotein translocase subunit YajC
MLVRPQRRRTQEQTELVDSLEVGDEVVSAGGFYAVIKEIEGETLHVEIADGLVVRMARNAVVGLVEHDEEQLDDDAAESTEDEFT